MKRRQRSRRWPPTLDDISSKFHSRAFVPVMNSSGPSILVRATQLSWILPASLSSSKISTAVSCSILHFVQKNWKNYLHSSDQRHQETIDDIDRRFSDVRQRQSNRSSRTKWYWYAQSPSNICAVCSVSQSINRLGNSVSGFDSWLFQTEKCLDNLDFHIIHFRIWLKNGMNCDRCVDITNN